MHDVISINGITVAYKTRYGGFVVLTEDLKNALKGSK